MNLYEVLGASRGTDAAGVKRAYRRGAARHHPDRGGSTAKMVELNRAWAVLGDDGRRAAYDRSGDEGVVDQRTTMLQELAGLMIQLVDTCPDVERNDILVAARMQIERVVKENRVAQAKFRAQAKKLGKALKRLKRKGGGEEGLVVGMFRARIAELERSAGKGDEVVARAEGMLELLGEYEYEVVAPMAEMGSTGSMVFGFLQQHGVVR